MSDMKKPIFSNRHYEYFAEYFGVNFARRNFEHEELWMMKGMMNDMIEIFEKDNKRFDRTIFRRKVFDIIFSLSPKPTVPSNFGIGGRENECYQA